MIIIGHRGARGLAPENTIASLKKALGCGVDQIEFDVRVSSDDVPVLFHNEALIDDGGDKLLVNRTSYAVLKNHKPNLATLAEALDFIKGKVPLYIEVKMGSKAQPVAETLVRYKYRYSIGSKSQAVLLKLHKLLPEVHMIVIEPWSGIKARRRAKELGTRTVSMYQLFLWSGFILAMSRAGYEVYSYTINSPRKARRWAKCGLAGVVTDYPDRFASRRKA